MSSLRDRFESGWSGLNGRWYREFTRTVKKSYTFGRRGAILVGLRTSSARLGFTRDSLRTRVGSLEGRARNPVVGRNGFPIPYLNGTVTHPELLITMRRAPSGSDRGAALRRDGFSLVELSVAISIVSVSLLGLGAVFISSQRSYETGLEEAIITHAFRRTIEQIRGEAFSEAAILYDGYQFQVPEIDGIGTVKIVVDETAQVPELGLPRDLDGDGAIGNRDVIGSYNLLPIIVQISWLSTQGDRTRQIFTYLSDEG